MSQKIYYGYKVVKVYDSRLVSCVNFLSQSCMVYKQNEWVSRNRKYGALCVFDNLSYVNNFLFMNYILNYKIYKCKYKKSKLNYVYNGYVKHCIFCLPIGTQLASSIMLLKEVK